MIIAILCVGLVQKIFFAPSDIAIIVYYSNINCTTQSKILNGRGCNPTN